MFKMNLNLKDKQLLLELDMNARQSLGQLAKNLRLSKRGVDYKMKRLEKEGVIMGYKALINSNKLGYYYFRILISFNYLDDKTEKEFEHYIKENKNFAYVFKTQGAYDYACALWVNDIIEFKKITDYIRFTWKNAIKLIEEHLPVCVTHLQNRFLLSIKNTKKFSIGGNVEKINLDKIEKGIIGILADNVRTPIYKIAIQLNADPKQISYRIKKLEKEKIILGYRAVLNYKTLGYSYFKCMISLANVDELEFNRIQNSLMMVPQVIFLNHGIGFAEIDLSAIFLTIEEFYSFIENLKKQFPNKISKYEIILFGENIKYNYAPFLV